MHLELNFEHCCWSGDMEVVFWLQLQLLLVCCRGPQRSICVSESSFSYNSRRPWYQRPVLHSAGNWWVQSFVLTAIHSVKVHSWRLSFCDRLQFCCRWKLVSVKCVQTVKLRDCKQATKTVRCRQLWGPILRNRVRVDKLLYELLLVMRSTLPVVPAACEG